MAYTVGARGANSEEAERWGRIPDFGFGIVTGGVVTLSAGLVLNVSAVAANDYVINGAVQPTAYSASTVTLTAAHATKDRLDIVYIDTAGAVGKVDGPTDYTGSIPFANAIGDTRLAFAEVKVVAAAGAVVASDILDKRFLLKPQTIWVQPHAVGGTATLADATDAPHTGALLGTAAADGIAYLVVPIPTNFQGLRSAKIVGLPNGTGNMHYIVATSFGASGEAKGANTDSIATTLVAVTDNQIIAIDIAAAFTGIAAGDFVGVNFTRDGDHASDTITDFTVFGLLLEYF